GFDRTRRLVIPKPTDVQKLVSDLDELIARLHDDAIRPHSQRLLAFTLDLSARIAAANGNINAIFLAGVSSLAWAGPFAVVLDNLTVQQQSLQIDPAPPADPDSTMQLTLRAMPLSSELAAVRTWVAGHLSADGARVVIAVLNQLAVQQLFDGYTSVRLTAFR